MCQNQNLTCSGGGGPGGPGGPGGGPYCGNGVLEPGEECDIVGGTTWCSTSCKLDLSSRPGANPITDLWMTIPALSGTKFGGSQFIQTPFSSGVVI